MSRCDIQLERVFLILLGLLLWSVPVGAVGDGNDLLPDIPVGNESVMLESLVDIGSDLVTDITNAGDSSGRLFIVSPNGVIRIYQDGALLPTPFLNAPASPPQSAMSGMAFHPDYTINGKLYVITGEATPNSETPHYSPPQVDNPDSAFDNVLVEYQVDALNPNLVDPSTRRELLRIHQPNGGHNMNDLAFGGDGYLYIAMGDGGATPFGSPTPYHTNAQLTDNPYGSILRIDVDAIGSNGRYAIPFDNLFADGVGGNVPEIFAWGFRNPWRVSSDRLTGEIYTGSNGDVTIESIYRVELGKNYGWDTKEGSFLWDPATGNASVDPSPDPAFTNPLGEYDHNGTTAAFGSVIGGFVYRGSALPGLYGKYLFSDYVAGKMATMDINTGDLELVSIDPAGAQLISELDITWGEDEDGELYIGRASGEVLKLVPVGADITSPTILSVTPTADLAGLNVVFSEPLESGSAETASNYSVAPGIFVNVATLQADGVTVRLATTSLANGVMYTLTVNNVQDLAFNAIAANSQATFSTPPPPQNSVTVNFQPTNAPVPSGDLKDDGAVYTASRGYGWTGGLSTRDREVQPDQRLDTFVFTNPNATATWQYDLPNGDYRVSLASGDASWSQGPHEVVVEGSPVITQVTTAPNEYVTVTDHLATVTDGALSITLGGSPGHTMLNYVTITEVAGGADITSPTILSVTPTADLAGLNVVFSEPLESGSAETASNYSVAPGIFVNVATLQADGVTVRLATTSLANGVMYTLTVNNVQDLAFNAIAANSQATFSTPPPPQNSVTVNFQPTNAPVPSGDLKDDGAVYTASRGYGWTGGLSTRDREVQPDQRLDTFVFTNPNATATWQYDLPNGDYRVSLASGDASWSQGPHEVVVEGSPVITQVTTAPNEYVTVTDHLATVTDGALSITLGGSPGHTMLNYVTITEVAGGADITSPTILSVTPTADLAGLNVVFSEPLESGSAETASNYSVAPGIFVNVATLQADGVTVRLATTSLANGVMYTLTVNNVQDLAFNAIAANSQATFSTPPPPQNSVTVNFQPTNAPVPSGDLKDDGAVYTASRGYGWTGGLSTRDREVQPDQRLDTFVFTNPNATATWQYDLPNGDYRVSLASGDASWSQGPHEVVVEGSPVITQVTTAPNEYVTVTDHLATVTDGALSITLGGSPGHTMLNYVTITEVSGE